MSKSRATQSLGSRCLRELGLAHIILADALVGGTADRQALWEWMAALLTWSRAAQVSGIGEAEIEELSSLAVLLTQRCEATGRVSLSNDEKDAVRRGSVVMDQLAAALDRKTARAVARWASETIPRLVRQQPPPHDSRRAPSQSSTSPGVPPSRPISSSSVA
ncbi:MAG: hypothetical protein KGN16_20960 [Burkholderiales bacterium]|nr:hypothetical protein [Burkholderiales bacterium]